MWPLVHSGQDLNWEDYMWPSRSKLFYEDLLVFRDNLRCERQWDDIFSRILSFHRKNVTQKPIEPARYRYLS